MPVLLVRHGEAVASQGDDAHRYLTFKGRADTVKVGAALRAKNLVAIQIVASPLVRAVQTAELLAIALGFEGVVTTDPAFVPEGDPAIAAKRIPTIVSAGFAGTPVTIIVCHEPIVRGIASVLTGQPHPGFRTSGCVMIEGTRVTLSIHPESV